MENYENIELIEETFLPTYFQKKIEPPTIEEIHYFHHYLSISFENGEIGNLISQFENTAEMPIEILCKYWMRVYSIENGKFFKILNTELRNKRYNLFLPFIKMSYEGLKRKVFDSTINEKLYSGG